MSHNATGSECNSDAQRETDAESAGWTWLQGFVDVGQGHFNNRDYSADEMVDAFMAGQEDVKAALAQMTRERDAAVKQARWLLKWGTKWRQERDAAVAREARLRELPKPTAVNGTWKVCPEYLGKIQEAVEEAGWGYVELEQVEFILLNRPALTSQPEGGA